MFEGDRDFYHGGRRPGLLSYLLVGLVGAVIGGIMVLYLAPGIVSKSQRFKEFRGDETSPPPITTGAQSPVIEIADKVSPTVVGISNRVNVSTFFTHQRVEKGAGSGVIFDENGYIVTNYHVIKDNDQLIVTLPDGKQVQAKLVGVDERTDLAVIKVDVKNLKAAVFGDSEKVRVGELAVAIGNPLGEQFASTVTAGVISALNRNVDVDEQRFQLLQTDAAISPGNSGGALVNSKGEVIGINSVKIVDVDVEGLNFAIPSNIVKPIVSSIIKNGKVIRPWLGILGGDVTPQVAEQYGLSTKSGILVSDLPQDSPAAKAGMQRGDVIISFNGEKLKDFADLRNKIEKFKIGDKVKVTVIRGKEQKTLNVTLEQLPQQ